MNLETASKKMDITIDEPDLEIIHEDLRGKNNDDRIDNECDRIYADELIGNRVKINYEAGWVSGTLKYFNTTLMEYNALLEDGTEDYIKEGDIDGKDIVLIDENVGEYITENQEETGNEISVKQPHSKSIQVTETPVEAGNSKNVIKDLQIVKEVTSPQPVSKIREIKIANQEPDQFDEKLSSPKKCNLCFEDFSDEESYKSHVKTIAEDANRLFSCQFCDKVFKKRQCLISHLKSIHKKRAMNSSSNVEKQKNSFHEIENTKPVQQKSTVTMENSGKIEDNLPRISCESCSEPFSNKGELSLHLLWTPEDSKKAFLCQFCQKLFEKRRCLEYHLKSVHKKMPLSEEFQEKNKNAQTTSQSPVQSIISTPVKVVSQMEKIILESPKSQSKKTPIVPRILKKNHKINDGLSIKKVEISGKQKRGASTDIEVLDEISSPKKMMKIPNVKLVYQQGKFL